MFDESLSEAWQARYGGETELPKNLEIDALIARHLNHRSVRKYSDRAVPESLVSFLVAAAQSASTSSNLQMWSIVSVQDPKRRKLLAELCDDQSQVETAPWFFMFFADQHRLATAAREAGEAADGLDYHEYYLMAVIDATLAAERMVAAAEQLGLGSCYIGALRDRPREVREVVGAPPQTFGVFGLCLGYPEESSTAEIKPRLAQECVWYRERFPEHPSIGDYNERMVAFYESQKMNVNASWAMRSGRRVDNNHLHGREILAEFAREQGLNLR